MRPLNEAQQRLLSSPAGFSCRARVRVLGPDGNWYDLSALRLSSADEARDFLLGVEVDENLESPVGQATVRLAREVRGLSLVPTHTGSRANTLAGAYSPLLDVARAFRVEVGLAVRGGEPGSAGWLPLFYGRVDEVDSGGEGLTLKGRDYAGVLQDAFTLEAQYGSAAGTALENVAQSLLNDAKLGAFGVYAPVALEWALGLYQQVREPVADALAKLATERGAEWRWRLRADTGDWTLFLQVPDRSGTAPVWEYGPDRYEALGQVALSLADVRTWVEVVYSDSADKDAAGQPKRKSVVREDTAATQRYGYLGEGGAWVPRLMRVAEAGTSNIRTLAAATRLAEAALADLSAPPLAVSVEVPAHPCLELNDMVRLTPNGVHFTTSQVLAVRQVAHSFSGASATTRLTLLGKPSLSPRAWLEAESRPGVAPSPAFTGPAAPSAVQVANAIAGAVLQFTAPDATTGPAAAQYELHLGSSPGFTLSAASLRAVSDTTSFSLQALSPDVTYYARVRSRDAKGNVGPASAEVTVSPRYLSPATLLPNFSVGLLPLNGELEAQSDTAAPPDGCSMLLGTWGTHAVVDGTLAYSGGRSVRLTTRTGGVRLGFQPFTARPKERLALKALFYAASSGVYPVLAVSWLDAGFSVLSTTQVQAEAVSGGAWATFSGYVTVPTTARYARVEVGASDSSPANVSLWVDSVVVQPALLVLPRWTRLRHPTLGGSLTDYENSWRPQATYPVRYRLDETGRVELSGTAKAPMTVASTSVIFILPEGYRPEQSYMLRTHNQGTLMSLYIYPNGQVTMIGVTADSDISLDNVRFQPA